MSRRRAIGYAFPYRAQARIVRGIFGVTVLPGTSILPPGLPGRLDYNPLETEPGSTDPYKAKELLEDAGYADGEYELSWAYDTSDEVSVRLTKKVVESFEAAGFTAAPFPMSSFGDLQRVNNDPDAPINIRQGTYGWCSDWPSGGSWFPLLFRSESEDNHSYFSEPAVDKEIDLISRLPPDQQPDQWGALDKAIMTEYYPVVITAQSGVAMLHGSRIGGMNADTAYGMPTWKDIHVLR